MKNKGAVYVLIAAILWGGIGIFVKNLERLKVSPMNIVFLRCLLTVIILAVVLSVKDRKMFKLSLRDIPLFIGNGIFSVVMFTYCYYQTIELSTLSVAAVLMYTAPIFVMIISVIFFKEKLTLNKVAALVLSFIGCAFVSGIVGSALRVSTSALIFGLLTGFGYSLYTIFGSRLVLRGYKTFTIIFYTFLFALAGALIILLVSGDHAAISYSPEVWFWAFLMAIFNTILPYFFYTAGLRSMDASKAPIIATVEPVAATVLGLFYGEKLSIFGVLGIILVLSSVVIVNIGGKSSRAGAVNK